MTILEGGAESASAIWTAPLAAGCRWTACHLKYVINSLMVLAKSGQNKTSCWSQKRIRSLSGVDLWFYLILHWTMGYIYIVLWSPNWNSKLQDGRSSATPITFGRCSWKSELPNIRPLSGWGLLVSKDVRSLPAALNNFDPSQGLPESTEALQSFRCPAVFRSLYLSWDGRILKDGRENRGLASAKAINIVSQKTLCNHLVFPTCPNYIKLIDNINYSRKVSDLKRALIPAMVIAQHTTKRLKTTYGTMAIWPLSLGSWKNLVKLNIITSTRQTDINHRQVLMVHRSRSMRNSKAPRIKGWKVSFNMVNPTFQNGRPPRRGDAFTGLHQRKQLGRLEGP